MSTALELLLLGVCATIATAVPIGTELTERESNDAVKDSDNKGPERYTRQAGTWDCYALVFDHPNLRGRSLLIRQQNANFNNDWFDNRVESAIISGTCCWIFYEYENFNYADSHTDTGSSHVLRPGTYNSASIWGGPGNHITSARALPPPGTTAIALFQQGNYEGRMVVLYGSSSHLQNVEFDDIISSAIVFGGTWRLCTEFSYRGTYSQLGVGEYGFLGSHSVGNDQLSSVQLL